MKRFFILASAAIVALASCAKTEVRYDNAEPQEIAFKQITGALTKAPVDMDHAVDMGVFAHTVAPTPAEYFGNTRFAFSTDAWKATPALYYPIQGELDFAYYSPYADGWTWNGSTSLESPALTDIANTDVLYGQNIKRSSKTSTPLSVVLGHALAKVTINVLTDDNSAGHIKITSVKLSNTYLGGKLQVTYASSALSDVVWSNTTQTDVSLTGSISLATAPQVFGTSFIIAEYDTAKAGTEYEQGTLTVGYTMDIDGAGAGTKEYSGEATFDLSPDGGPKAYWYVGNNYIYNIKATLTEITFAPQVEPMVDTNFSTDPVVL